MGNQDVAHSLQSLAGGGWLWFDSAQPFEPAE